MRTCSCSTLVNCEALTLARLRYRTALVTTFSATKPVGETRPNKLDSRIVKNSTVILGEAS